MKLVEEICGEFFRERLTFIQYISQGSNVIFLACSKTIKLLK